MGFADDSSSLDRLPGGEEHGRTAQLAQRKGEQGIAWGVPGQVPGEEPGCLPVFRAPTQGGVLSGVWVSDHLQAVRVHWDGLTTRPCRGGVGLCAFCDRSANIRLVSYGAALLRSTAFGLVELSQDATRANLRWCEPGAGLRGKGFSLRRVKQGPYARVVAQTSADLARLPDGITLPPEPDLRAALLKIWAG